MNQIVVFQVDKYQYGVDIQQVNSVEKLLEITYIPQTHTDNFVKGIIQSNGIIIPIIDLKEYFNVGKTKIMERTKILFVCIKNIHAGLLVDSATEVLELNESDIDTTTGSIKSIQQTSFFKGVVKSEDRLLILLNLENILMNDEIMYTK